MGVIKPSEIKAMRMRLGFSQSKLAKLAGVTQAYIAKIESGKADPRFSTLERISKVLEQASAPVKQVLVERIMSAPIVFIRPQDRVETAIKTMKAHEISQLPILDRDVQVGSISETIVVQRMGSGENMAKLLRRSVSEIMDKPFPTVPKDADVSIAYPILEHAPAILVMDHGKPAGIITKADVFKLAVKP